MRVFFFLIIVILCACARVNVSSQVQQDPLLYKVENIESINDLSIVYASRQDTLYKILSLKDARQVSRCEKIKAGRYYSFRLHSRRKNLSTVNGQPIGPVNYRDIHCYTYADGTEKGTEVCIEPEKGIHDLYYADNLQGLCLIK